MSSNGLLSEVILLLKDHRPEGIGLMDISREFYNMFGNRLNLSDHNFKSLYEMMEILSEKCGQSVILVKRNTNHFKSDRIMIHQKNYDQWIQSFKNRQNIPFLESLVIPILPKDVPLQQNRDGLPVWSTSCPEDYALRNTSVLSFRAKVIHVNTPNEMYVRLHTNKQSYQKLGQMLRFYDGKEVDTDRYILPKELAVKDYLCAARNPEDWDNWHRALIVETDREEITLFAIDYGNKFKEDRKELRLLKEPLFMIPSQAIKISLEGVAPTLNGREERLWSESSIGYFRRLIDRYKNKIEIVFLERLANNYFSVFMETYVDVDVEDWPPKFAVYFHEAFIKSGFAEKYERNFDENDGLFGKEASEEPLLAIKYEPEFVP